MNVESFVNESNVFEGAWMEATDLGVIEKTAASFIWHSAIGFATSKTSEQDARIAELTAEVERYRKALGVIANLGYDDGLNCRFIARNALREGE